MPGYKLLLFDLDGTLLTPERRVDPKTLEAITRLRERGLSISLATGRSPRSAADHAEVIGPNAPLIHFNGAMVADRSTGEVIDLVGLDREHALAALAEAEALDLHVNLYVGDEILVARRTPVSQTSEAKDGVPHTVVGHLGRYLACHPEAAPIKLLCIGPPERFSSFARAVSRTTGGACDVINSEPHYFEVLTSGVTKARGARALLDRLALDPAEVIAFGDNLNDLEMIELCGLGVAMGNAHPQLREAADVVIGPNDGDSIAQFLAQELELVGSELVRDDSR